MQCVARGIYHNTLSTKWCYQQPELAVLRRYVHERFIMDSDVTRLNENQPVPESNLSRIIWYPETADEATPEELLYLLGFRDEAARCPVSDCM
jgi:hypothetical protein